MGDISEVYDKILSTDLYSRSFITGLLIDVSTRASKVDYATGLALVLSVQ